MKCYENIAAFLKFVAYFLIKKNKIWIYQLFECKYKIEIEHFGPITGKNSQQRSSAQQQKNTEQEMAAKEAILFLLFRYCTHSSNDVPYAFMANY